MAVYVNTNASSLHGRRQLNNVQNQLSTSYQRLSSGMRINSAKDDAAGLQISSRLTSQINGLNQGNRNAADGIALAQTAEGGMNEMTSMLQKVRTLAVQAANGTNTAEDRAALKKESDALGQEFDRIVTQTRFGGKTIFDGGEAGKGSIYDGANGSDKTKGVMLLQVGGNKSDTISFTIEKMALSLVVNDKTVFDAAKGFALSTADGASKVIAALDKAIAVVDSRRADLGSVQNRLEASIRNQANVSANQADARSRIRDADFAEESANMTQQNIILQAATSMLMQANSRPQLALSMLG